VIDEASASDPASAAAEWLACFRTDVEGFVTREAVEACVAPGILERPVLHDQIYKAFVDPSGGSADSFCLAISHREKDVIIIDAVRERKPPFSPEAVVNEFAELLRSYRICKVTGDRYAGDWPRERFREHGIAYEPSDKPKSDLYRDLLPVLNSRKLDLLDDQRLLAQLTSLERRTARGGKDSIDHPPGSHDDLANAVAGAAFLARKPGYSLDWIGGDDVPLQEALIRGQRSCTVSFQSHWQRNNFAQYVMSGGYRRPPWSY
jgi:hypothetical protein